jgi:Na+/melibiose symporter-like transporter
MAMRLGTTARRARMIMAAALGVVVALAVPALALAAEGDSAPPSPFSAFGALAIICVMAVALFVLGLFGVRGAVRDARIEHDAEE